MPYKSQGGFRQRPPKQAISIYLEPICKKMLDRIAKAEGVSRSDVISELIRRHYESSQDKT